MNKTNKKNRDTRQSGFTMVEILMATVIIGIAVMGSSSAMLGAAQTKHELEDEAPFQATLLAKEIHELAQALPKTPSGVVGVTKAADIAALDSLVGATFDPPICANGKANLELAGWTQEVDLQLYDLNDLSAATGETAWMGVDKHSERMYKLIVTIKQHGAVVDTYNWWVTP